MLMISATWGWIGGFQKRYCSYVTSTAAVDNPGAKYRYQRTPYLYVSVSLMLCFHAHMLLIVAPCVSPTCVFVWSDTGGFSAMRLIWSQRSLGSCSVGPGGKNRGHYGSQGSSLAPQTTDPTNTSSSSSSLGLQTHRTDLWFILYRDLD